LGFIGLHNDIQDTTFFGRENLERSVFLDELIYSPGQF